jgi:hypothetical protein
MQHVLYLSILHVHDHAACSSTCLCGFSMSIMHVQVKAVPTWTCSRDKDMQLVLEHAAWTWTRSRYRAMQHGQGHEAWTTHAARTSPCWMSIPCLSQYMLHVRVSCYPPLNILYIYLNFVPLRFAIKFQRNFTETKRVMSLGKRNENTPFRRNATQQPFANGTMFCHIVASSHLLSMVRRYRVTEWIHSGAEVTGIG